MNENNQCAAFSTARGDRIARSSPPASAGLHQVLSRLPVLNHENDPDKACLFVSEASSSNSILGTISIGVYSAGINSRAGQPPQQARFSAGRQFCYKCGFRLIYRTLKFTKFTQSSVNASFVASCLFSESNFHI
jgi:hypothetical protein